MKEVFDCYPEVDKIYVVDGMPFLTETPAINHSKAVGKPVETVWRNGNVEAAPVATPEVPETITATDASPESQDSGKASKRKK